MYAKKTIFNSFSLIFQFARDHLRQDTQIKRNQDYPAALIEPKHWYWMGKMEFNF